MCEIIICFYLFSDGVRTVKQWEVLNRVYSLSYFSRATQVINAISYPFQSRFSFAQSDSRGDIFFHLSCIVCITNGDETTLCHIVNHWDNDDILWILSPWIHIPNEQRTTHTNETSKARHEQSEENHGHIKWKITDII